MLLHVYVILVCTVEFMKCHYFEFSQIFLKMLLKMKVTMRIKPTQMKEYQVCITYYENLVFFSGSHIC